MTKKVTIGAKPNRPENLRLWEEEEARRKPRTRRITFDIDADLHQRIRLDCVRRGVHLADEMRAIVSAAYSQKDDSSH